MQPKSITNLVGGLRHLLVCSRCDEMFHIQEGSHSESYQVSKFGLLSIPIERSGILPISNLIQILSTIKYERIPLVTGNAGRVFESYAHVKLCRVDHQKRSNFLSQVLQHIVMQVRITRHIVELGFTDTWIFFFGGEYLILPMVTAGLLKKR